MLQSCASGLVKHVEHDREAASLVGRRFSFGKRVFEDSVKYCRFVVHLIEGNRKEEICCGLPLHLVGLVVSSRVAFGCCGRWCAMANLTSQGVCYDLTETPYVVEHNGMMWHFSSAPHRNKFRREVRKRELWLNDSLSKRFGCTMMLDIVADIQLYRQVETRGFYVVTNDGAEYFKPESIVIAPNEMVIGIVPASDTLASMLGGGLIG